MLKYIQMTQLKRVIAIVHVIAVSVACEDILSEWRIFYVVNIVRIIKILDETRRNDTTVVNAM